MVTFLVDVCGAVVFSADTLDKVIVNSRYLNARFSDTTVKAALVGAGGRGGSNCLMVPFRPLISE